MRDTIRESLKVFGQEQKEGIYKIKQKIRGFLGDSDVKTFSTQWGDVTLLEDEESFRCTLWDRDKLTMHMFFWYKPVGGRFTSYDYKKDDYVICEVCSFGQHLCFLEEVLEQIDSERISEGNFLEIFNAKKDLFRKKFGE